jgi:hypothetical protein
MNEQYEKLESLANDFNVISPNNCFLKEKITNVYFTNKFRINYKDYFVAISKNGGLIATCKKKSDSLEKKFLRETTNTIIVMQQNGKKQYKISLTLNYAKRWIVAFDFSQNENLYGICNDGTIYKFDILLQEAKEQVSTQAFETDNIIKAKFFQKGFIALTHYGIFYYIKDFKNIIPKSIFHMKSLLEFTNINNVDFIGIPPDTSRSGKLELIFTNEKGEGIINVTEQPEKYDYNILPIEINNKVERTIDHVFQLKEKELEPYIIIDNDEIPKQDDFVIVENNNINNINTNNKTVGKIIAIAISPSYEQVALYNNKGNVYIFNSKFTKGKKEAKFEINKDLTKQEQDDIQYIINYQPNCQFLFCGEDALALFGKKYVLITNDTFKKTLVYKITEEEKHAFFFVEDVYGKCISEVDGLRISTNNGIYFISKVDKNLFEACYPFAKSNSKKLLKAYNSYLIDELDNGEKIKELGDSLSTTIFVLLNAAANIYWKEEETDEVKKEAQMYLLKAAQLGKIFANAEEEFNHDKFLGICKDLRVVNNLRNNEESQILITYKEYESLTFQELIKKILIQHNFNLAFKISNYLIGYDTKKIYQKWACAKIKKLNRLANKSEQIKLYDNIIYSLSNIKNVSYIQLAKKAFKCKHNELGMKFLENEKSILAKIPIYLKMNKLEKVLELSYETYDSNVIEIALNQLIDYTGVDNYFIEKVKDNQKLRYAVIDLLKKYDKSDTYIDKYLEEIKDYEELMLLQLEKFFTYKEIDKKKKCLKLAKEYQKNLDKNNVNNKFYLMYLTELSNSIKFKKDCMDLDRKIISKSYIKPFDNSIYDCYKFGAKENKLDWIEKQNKHFELSSKKMTLMRFRSLAENGKIVLIEDIIKNSSLKKLSITPINMADFYFEFKNYDLATKYVKLITHQEYFDYKIEMLKYMEKYEDLLEVAISSKNLDKIPDIINDVLKRKPELQNKVDELCKNYKINLS